MKSAGRLALPLVLLAVAGFLTWKLFVENRGPSRPRLVADAPGAAGPSADQAASSRSSGDEARAVPRKRAATFGASIEGVVRDDARQPVGDAEVQIVQRSFNTDSTRPADRRFDETVVASTTSDADGRYSFDKLVAGELKTIRALKPGFATVFADVRAPGAKDLDLVPGIVLKGRVVDSVTKAPVADVGVKGWNGAVGGVKDAKWTDEVFTSTTGRFEFEAVPAGVVTLMLAHPEYVDRHVEQGLSFGSAGELVLEIQRGLAIEGVVLDNRSFAPVSDARVSGRDDNPVVPRWSARTDSNGVFRMKGIRPGKVPFEISGRGIGPLLEVRELSDEADFTGGKKGKRLEFRVDPAGRAKGRVLTRAGEPIQSARLFVTEIKGAFPIVRDPSAHGGSLGSGEVRTDAAGTFVIEDLARNQVRVVADAPGYAIAVSEPLSANPGETVDDVLVTMDQAPVVAGMVKSAAGSPVADARVVVSVPQFEKVWFRPGFEPGQQGQRTAVTDAGGRYRVELPYPGKFGVRVEHPDYVVDEATGLAVEDLQIELRHDVTLEPALAIAGTVTREDGQPVAGAIVRAWPQRALKPIETSSDASGGYAFTRLPKGLYRLGASSDALSAVSEFRDDVPAGTTNVDLRLGPRGEITGTVTLPGGSPLGEYRVSVRPMWNTALPREEWKHSTAGLAGRDLEVKDSRGAFRIKDVEPGLWAAIILAPGLAPSFPVTVRVQCGASASVGTIALDEGSTLHGKITDPSGAPAEGVTVSVSRLGNLESQDPTKVPPSVPLSCRTDASGEYEIKGMTGGRYFVKVKSERHLEPRPSPLDVPERSSIEQSFTLRVAAKVEVRVKDELGDPLPLAIINVLDGDKKRLPLNAEGTASIHTDDHGRLSVAKLPAGDDLTFRAVRAGFVVAESVRKLTEGDAGVVELRLQRVR